jgi:predicted transcriptional regulator
MVSHMKTTIEIADDLFERAQKLAHREGTTLRAVTEEGLRMVLAKKRTRHGAGLKPLVTFAGKGLTRKFEKANWDEIRDEIYQGRGT